MSDPLRIGVAGLGTVGVGLVRLLREHGQGIMRASGREVVITAVSSRDRQKDRGISLEDVRWVDDATALAVDPDIDVFVELIGGEEGIARKSVEAALAAGKHVVTANKALLARHGLSLAALAEKHGVCLNYEAAVAGGIPVIKAMRESLNGSEVTRVYGILNGTCNFILTQMQTEGRAFEDVLEQAQALGYAEADPTFDIGGFDAAHKLALLTTLAFGTRVALDEIHIEGIEGITSADIEAADDLGYRIKLLGVALKTDSGIECRVHPTMVPRQSALAEVSGVTNCVGIEGDFVGNLLLVGPGAGGEATASAVASDIADIARGIAMAPFILRSGELEPYRRARMGAHAGAYYIRLSVIDRPGAFATIAQRMADSGVSLESIVQRRPRAALPGVNARPEPGSATPVVLITHETTESAIRDALAGIESDGQITGRPQMIRIETL